MSQRFLRWAEKWIEENIPPGANPDRNWLKKMKMVTELIADLV
jgi:hypothetical protein